MTQEAITSYDAMGREVSSTDQNTGEVTTTTYDFMGRVVKTERSLTDQEGNCLLYTSPSPRDRTRSRMPSSA